MVPQAVPRKKRTYADAAKETTESCVFFIAGTSTLTVSSSKRWVQAVGALWDLGGPGGGRRWRCYGIILDGANLNAHPPLSIIPSDPLPALEPLALPSLPLPSALLTPPPRPQASGPEFPSITSLTAARIKFILRPLTDVFPNLARLRLGALYR